MMYANPKRILVRGPNWIGDQVMALPFYRSLRAYYRTSYIVQLCSQDCVDVLDPTVFDEVFVLPSTRRSLPNLWAVSRELAKKRFDLAITIPASTSSALLLWLAGIRNRVGYGETFSHAFLTSLLPWEGRESRRHKSQLYFELLSHVSGRDFLEMPQVALDRDPNSEHLVVISPGAAISLREWPYYQELLIELRHRFPALRLVVVGAQKEAKWHSLLKRMGDMAIEDWVEKTSLKEVQGLCAKARLVVANDSGIAHVAATLGGAPTVVVMGPGDPYYVKPLGREVKIVRLASLPCSPCEKPSCLAPYGYQHCLKALSVEAVMNVIAFALEDGQP